jgi:hypothetical protein
MMKPCHDANMDANRNRGETHRRKKARLEAGLFYNGLPE